MCCYVLRSILWLGDGGPLRETCQDMLSLVRDLKRDISKRNRCASHANSASDNTCMFTCRADVEGHAKYEAVRQVALNEELTDVWHSARGRRFGLYKHWNILTSWSQCRGSGHTLQPQCVVVRLLKLEDPSALQRVSNCWGSPNASDTRGFAANSK
jgi:hypothetical protein